MSCIGYTFLGHMPPEQDRLRRVETSTSTEFPCVHGSIERDIYSSISAIREFPDSQPLQNLARCQLLPLKAIVATTHHYSNVKLRRSFSEPKYSLDIHLDCMLRTQNDQLRTT